MGELYSKTVKPQMQLKKSFHKTKNLFLKTLHNLKSFLFKGQHKLPKVCHFNPFFSGSNRIPNSIIQELDDFYRDFSQQWEHGDQNEVLERNSICEESVENSMENQERMRKEEKRRATFNEEKIGDAFFKNTSKGQILAQKMKELDLMDEEDLNQMLDIQEVLHYYSHLNCPFYLDIVDSFFMDMYNEFSLPQPFININSSMRSLGPIEP
ncbi:uncharacterized protein LOC107800498 [Nicotiana tabacum]|uniref:Uncharacterized protein LOC107800498 n=1 Tax=Nicotiana tabacum TaxID=4097 RepID=A0A1S4AQY6_TOBAC|nr:PREDICTED: uncharacterized protein LOC107800498 [Nicotiana tabacum]